MSIHFPSLADQSMLLKDTLYLDSVGETGKGRLFSFDGL
jgi:hypothetical protein